MDVRRLFIAGLLVVAVAYIGIWMINENTLRRARLQSERSFLEAKEENKELLDSWEQLSDQQPSWIALENEAKEKERAAIRKAMEEEPQRKLEVARKRREAEEYEERMEQAWLEYYTPPEQCENILYGEQSNRCLQHKMEAKREFIRNYVQAKSK